MKLGRRILATVAAVVVAVVMTGCPSPLRPPPVEWVTVFDFATDATFQALPVGVPLTDEMLLGTPFENNGAELMMVEHDGGLALRIVTPGQDPEWRGIIMLNSVLGFAVGDVITITGEVLSAEGQPHLSEDITAFVPLQDWNPILSAGGPFSHEFDPLSTGSIAAIRTNTAWDNPPHLRFHVNRMNSETLITGFTLAGNRPIGFEPPPPPPPPPVMAPLSIALQNSADRFVTGTTAAADRTARFNVTTFGLTNTVIDFNWSGNWGGPGSLVEVATPTIHGSVTSGGQILINQAGTGSGVLTLTPPAAVPAGFYDITLTIGGETATSWLRVWPSTSGTIMTGEFRGGFDGRGRFLVDDYIEDEDGEEIPPEPQVVQLTVIANLGAGPGVIYFSSDNVRDLPDGIVPSGTFNIDEDGLGLGTLTLTGVSNEESLSHEVTVWLQGHDHIFELDVARPLVFSLQDFAPDAPRAWILNEIAGIRANAYANSPAPANQAPSLRWIYGPDGTIVLQVYGRIDNRQGLVLLTDYFDFDEDDTIVVRVSVDNWAGPLPDRATSYQFGVHSRTNWGWSLDGRDQIDLVEGGAGGTIRSLNVSVAPIHDGLNLRTNTGGGEEAQGYITIHNIEIFGSRPDDWENPWEND